MAVFDVVAGGAVADVPVDGGAVVFAPTPPVITLALQTAVATAGASALAPLATVTITAPAASIQAGVRIDAPVVQLALSGPAAGISVSARIDAPEPTAVALAAPAAAIAAGASVAAPVASIAVLALAATAAAGKAQFPPVSAIALSAPVAAIAISAKIDAPVAQLALSGPGGQVVGGNYIDASNEESTLVNGGEVAGDSVAEFPVADGSSEIVIRKVPPRFVLGAPVAVILAGKAQFPPTAVIALSASTAEVVARRRKLRVMAIAS